MQTGASHHNHSNSVGLSLNHQYSTSGNAGASATPSESGGFVTSPPKRGGQTRKPSGKSTKSNRAAIAKKQLITHSSH